MAPLSRKTLLIEFGPYAGGGSNAKAPTGVSGNIPNVASARGMHAFDGLDPKKEKERREAAVRRRLRLRELIREWLATRKPAIQ